MFFMQLQLNSLQKRFALRIKARAQKVRRIDKN